MVDFNQSARLFPMAILSSMTTVSRAAMVNSAAKLEMPASDNV